MLIFLVKEMYNEAVRGVYYLRIHKSLTRSCSNPGV